MELRFASLADILSLRKAVIIAGTDRNSPYFVGDEDERTRHIGAFEEECCVGCATYLYSEWKGHPAWHLRGMATTPERQRRGIGTALLQFAETALPREFPEITIIWCNAREAAAAFYERNGWRRESDLFVIEGVGPHYRMTRDLS
jgi:GNAT superfamily N-acetyltransferase